MPTMTKDEEDKINQDQAKNAQGAPTQTSPLNVPLPADAPNPNDPNLVTAPKQPGETFGTRIVPEFAREAYGNLQQNMQLAQNRADQYASPFAQGPSLLLNSAGALSQYGMDMATSGSQAFGNTVNTAFNNLTAQKPAQQPTQSTALPSPTNMAQGNNTTQQNTISDLAKQSNESYNLIGQQAPANQLGTGNGFAPASPLQRQPSPAPQPAPLVSYGAMGAFTDANASLRDQLAARNTPEALAYDIAMRNRVRADNGQAPIQSPFAPIQSKNGADLGDMISLANFNRQGQQDVAQQRQKIYESLTGQFKESPEDMQVINAAMSNGATAEELLAIGSQPDTESRKDGLNKLLKAMQQEQARKQGQQDGANQNEQTPPPEQPKVGQNRLRRQMKAEQEQYYRGQKSPLSIFEREDEDKYGNIG